MAKCVFLKIELQNPTLNRVKSQVSNEDLIQKLAKWLTVLLPDAQLCTQEEI